MTELNITGGARIGWANAQWPFATLSVTKDKMELNSSILGNLVFKPADIISIEIGDVTLFKKGIQINHRVDNYSAKVLFSASDGPDVLYKKIHDTGFLTNKGPIPPETAMEIEAMQASGTFPFRTPAIIAIILIWNICCLATFFNIYKESARPGSFSGIAVPLGFMLLTCVLLLTAQPVRSLLLKEGRTVEHIKKAAYFIIAICTFMLIGFLSMPHLTK